MGSSRAQLPGSLMVTSPVALSRAAAWFRFRFGPVRPGGPDQFGRGTLPPRQAGRRRGSADRSASWTPPRCCPTRGPNAAGGWPSRTWSSGPSAPDGGCPLPRPRNWSGPGTPGLPSDTGAAKLTSGRATPTTRSGHADHPSAVPAFRKLDALAVLTAPLLPAPLDRQGVARRAASPGRGAAAGRTSRELAYRFRYPSSAPPQGPPEARPGRRLRAPVRNGGTSTNRPAGEERTHGPGA